MSRASIEYRIRHKTRTTDRGCWLWLGLRDRDGYGRTTVGGRDIHAHRAIYESLVGPVPDGLQLDHTCRTRACCNPAHLEPVTHIENVRRGLRARADEAARILDGSGALVRAAGADLSGALP